MSQLVAMFKHTCECPFDVTNTVSPWVGYLSNLKHLFLLNFEENKKSDIKAK